MTTAYTPGRYLKPLAVLVLVAPLLGAGGTKLRIIQTNSAGDAVTLIDPATNKVVGEIKDIEVNHGAAVSPDGSRIYISDEAESTLDVADAKTLAVIKRVPLSGHPNNISIGKDGRRVYIAIAQPPGALDVGQGSPSHGIGITPDGKTLWATSKWYGYVYAYSMPDLKLLGGLPVGMDPDWLTFTPDSKSLYVAAAGSNVTTVVDVKSIKE